jgi:hypothetical protein
MSPRARRKHFFEFRMAPAATMFLCLFLAAGCDEKNPIGPTVPVDRPFVLGLGEVSSIEGTAVRMRFEEVTSDSRCPIHAICVWAGDAVVAISLLDGIGSSRHELHTSDASRRSATHRNVRIEVVDLQPYPFSGQPVDLPEYRATFRATRSD